MNTYYYLVLFDADRVQDYIFATRKLKEIRGASFLLEELNQETENILKRTPADHFKKIFIGGGGGAVKFANPEEAQDFCIALETLYLEQTITASITTHMVKIPSSLDGAETERWVDFLKRAEMELSQKKAAKNQALPIIAIPYAKLCDLCGQLPANRRRPGSFDGLLICNACEKKNREGDQYKHSPIYALLESALGNAIVRWPEELEDIGAAATPQGYLGLIYADGNRMGEMRREILRRQPDTNALIEAYSQFSTSLSDAVKRAIIEATIKHLGQPQPNKIYPLQFFISGGDDLLAVVPAQHAIPVALDFCENFETCFQNYLGAKGTMAVGVALAKDHYPLAGLIRVAKELQKSAKRWNRELWQKNGMCAEANTSVIDFIASSDMMLTTVDHQRQQQLRYDDVLLTQRPYQWEELKKLIQAIKNLQASEFPKNKLTAMLEPLYRGRLNACLDFLTLLTRLSDNGQPSPRQAFLGVAHAFELNPFPWRRKREGLYETPMLDIVELYDFIYRSV